MSVFDDVPEPQQAQPKGQAPGIPQRGKDLAQGVSKVAGVLFGAANAPLAFIKGMMNTPTHSPEEWDKMNPIQKGVTMIGGGLDSAGRSAFKEGDWGEQYDTYYKNKTGRAMEEDFGGASNSIKLGLDLMIDPLFGPAMAADMAAKGIRTIADFGKYVSKGEIPMGAQSVMRIPKQTIADLHKVNSQDAAEKMGARQGLADVLKGQLDKKLGETIYLGEGPLEYPPVVYDPAATKSLVENAAGSLDDYSKNILLSTDEFLKPGWNTTIEAERAAQPPMYIGKGITFTLEEKNPELAKELENFLSRDSGKGDHIWKPTILEGPLESTGKPEGLIKPEQYSSSSGTKVHSVAGLGAGIEEDDEGNLTYDIKKGLLGTVAMAGGLKILGASKTARRPGGVFTKLFSENTEISQAAKDVGAMYDLTKEEMSKIGKVTLNKVKAALVRGGVDVSGNIKKAVMKADPTFGKEMVMRRELVAGASSRASNMIEEYRGMIFDGLSSDESSLLDKIIQSKRTIAIDEYKGSGTVAHPMGLGGTEHQAFLDGLEQTLPKEVYADINGRADFYFEAMQEQLKMRFDEGLLSPESYSELSKHLYSPREFMQHLDDQSVAMAGKITVPEKHIKALKEGSEGLLWNDAQDLLAQTVYRTQDLIFKNRANKALYDFAQVAPESGIAKVAEVAKRTKDGKAVLQEAPAGWQKVGAFVEGERKEIMMPKEMAEEWVKSDPLINQSLANMLQWVTGTKLVKLFATGVNPVFALANIPRDVALIWNATNEYSKHLPVAMGQMTRDFSAVAGDVFKRTGRVKDFVDQGGGMNLLTHYGRMSGEGVIGEKLDGLQKVLGWVGETSEIWSRIALRERALRNGSTAEEATWIARRYLDFSQGGNVIKALDTGMPYLNASVQGTRSIFRAAKENPGLFAYKFAQLGTLSAGLYYANMSINPEAWRQVSDRDKEANFIVTTPFSYTDSSGQQRHYVVKIPKDQGQRIATSFMDSLLARVHEGKYPTDQMLQAIGDLVGFGSFPPIFAAALAYMGNKDTWTMDDVWKGPEVNPKEEYTQDTHQLWKAGGQITGASPERMSRAAGKIIPQNNFFVGLVGGGLKEILNQFNDKEKIKTTEEMLASNPSVRRFVTSTSPYGAYRKDIERLRIDETTRRYKQTRELDDISDRYFKTKDPALADKISSFIEAQPEADRDRLINRIEHFSQTAQLPDRSWWVNVGSLPYQARATAFLDRFDKENALGKMRMIQLSDKVSGFNSDDFINALTEEKQKRGNK